MPHRGESAFPRGTCWHLLVSLCAFAAAPVQAQTDAGAAPELGAEDAQGVGAGEGEAGSAEAEAGPGEVGPGEETEPRPSTADPAAPLAAAAVAEPPVDAERPPSVALGAPGAEETLPPPSAAERPRGWRFPREHVRRPLTLPQGVLRFDSTVTLSVAPVAFGSRFYQSGFAGVAAGLVDDFEIGATPLGITWIPFGLNFSDPYLYARARVLSGEQQIAFRAGVSIPTSQTDARMELAAELALLVTDWLRVDTGVDYALLFSSPLHQRVGVPVTATAQLGRLQSLALTLAVYVFNDFDDVDVPLLLRYAITFRGYQGPLGEYSIEGGFTDLERAVNAWTIQSRFTWFAYL